MLKQKGCQFGWVSVSVRTWLIWKRVILIFGPISGNSWFERVRLLNLNLSHFQARWRVHRYSAWKHRRRSLSISKWDREKEKKWNICHCRRKIKARIYYSFSNLLYIKCTRTHRYRVSYYFIYTIHSFIKIYYIMIITYNSNQCDD